MSSQDLSGFHINLLDSLPYGISVQTNEREIIFENKYIVDILGSGVGELCYKRWDYQLQDGEKSHVCRECPGHISLQDREQHFVNRIVELPNGEKRKLQITHSPLIDADGEKSRFIEIIKDITDETNYALLNLVDNVDLYGEISLGVVEFDGSTAGSKVLSTYLPFVNFDLTDIDPLDLFYMKTSAFWFTSIGQGHNWKNGLFGPLPVLDTEDYISFAYAFRKPTSKAIDSRLKGEPLFLFLIFIHDRISPAMQSRLEIENYLKSIINKFQTREEIVDNMDITSVQHNFITFLRDL